MTKFFYLNRGRWLVPLVLVAACIILFSYARSGIDRAPHLDNSKKAIRDYVGWRSRTKYPQCHSNFMIALFIVESSLSHYEVIEPWPTEKRYISNAPVQIGDFDEVGIGQHVPRFTAASMRPYLTNIYTNIEASFLKIAWLRKQYDGDMKKVAEAYHRGQRGRKLKKNRAALRLYYRKLRGQGAFMRGQIRWIFDREAQEWRIEEVKDLLTS